MNFDNILYEYCVKEFKLDHFDIESQSIDVQESLYKKCQIAKTSLSTEENTKVIISCGIDVYEVQISRKIYEDLITEQVNETIKCVRAAIKDAEIEESDIDEIILAGGATLTPLIRSTLITNFGDKLNTSVKPYEAGKYFQSHRVKCSKIKTAYFFVAIGMEN